jgi:adenylylsulfate kinase
MIDSKKRKILKSISYRILGTLSISIISYIVTSSIKTSGIIGIIHMFTNMLLYVLHDFLWERVSWGKSKGMFIQMTGLSGSGKSTIANKAKIELEKQGYRVEVIDGDYYREHLCKDLGFSKNDRNENIKRLGFVGNVLAKNGIISIMSAINPYEEIRAELRKFSNNTKTIYIKADIDTLIHRDPKGLYKRAMLPDNDPNKLKNFTGISDTFDPPLVCDLVIETDKQVEEESVKKLVKYIIDNT